MLVGCGANKPSDAPKSEDQSVAPSQKSEDDKVDSSEQPGGQSSAAPKSSDTPVVQGEFTFNDSELNTPQEIHTADQKKYLNLNKEYYHITGSDLSSCNANGNSNQSTPKQVTVKWNYGVPEGKTLSKFQLLYGQKADLSDAYTVEGNKNNSISFYNPY